MPYDGYDKRVYEAWELQLMFQNEISKDEAQIVCSQKGQGYAITHNQLVDLIRLKTGMLPGNAPFQSVFVQKYQTSTVAPYLK